MQECLAAAVHEYSDIVGIIRFLPAQLSVDFYLRGRHDAEVRGFQVDRLTVVLQAEFYAVRSGFLRSFEKDCDGIFVPRLQGRYRLGEKSKSRFFTNECKLVSIILVQNTLAGIFY